MEESDQKLKKKDLDDAYSPEVFPKEMEFWWRELWNR
jgi:hypothetical protein